MKKGKQCVSQTISYSSKVVKYLHRHQCIIDAIVNSMKSFQLLAASDSRVVVFKEKFKWKIWDYMTWAGVDEIHSSIKNTLSRILSRVEIQFNMVFRVSRNHIAAVREVYQQCFILLIIESISMLELPQTRAWCTHNETWKYILLTTFSLKLIIEQGGKNIVNIFACVWLAWLFCCVVCVNRWEKQNTTFSRLWWWVWYFMRSLELKHS